MGFMSKDDRLLVGNGQDGNLNSVDPAIRAISHIAKTDSGIDGLPSHHYPHRCVQSHCLLSGCIKIILPQP